MERLLKCRRAQNGTGKGMCLAVIILEGIKKAWAAADLKLLYVQLFPGKIEHLNTLLLAFTQDCPLHHAKCISACVQDSSCLLNHMDPNQHSFTIKDLPKQKYTLHNCG